MTVTTYRATATRDGRGWSVRIEGLPEGKLGLTQGRTLVEARDMAREATALLLDVPEDTIAIDLHVAGADALVDEVTKARAAREAAASDEQSTLTKVAKALTAMGLTQKDAAVLLDLSPQRLAQLAPKRAG